jgi:hypothetical protein
MAIISFRKPVGTSATHYTMLLNLADHVQALSRLETTPSAEADTLLVGLSTSGSAYRGQRRILIVENRLGEQISAT